MHDGQGGYKKSSSIRLSCHGAETLDRALISESTGSSEKSIQKTNKINIELSDQCNNKDKGNFGTSMLQSVTKIMGKTAIGAISFFYPLPPLTMLRNNEQNLRQAMLWVRYIV